VPGPPTATSIAVDPLARFSQQSREAAAAAVVAAGLLVVLGLWWADTPAGSLHNLGDALSAAGRVSGLAGTYLLLVLVLLMGRIPWLDRTIGMDRLAVWHRWTGQYVVGLLAAHAAALVAGYALADHISLVSETGRIVLDYPDVLAATVSLGLLVAIGVSSARAARRRIAYQTWYFVHLYAYLAVVLGFSHQLATGSELADHPAKRAFWVGLHLATAGLLVWYRLVVPIAFNVRHRLRVEAVVAEGPGVVSIVVAGERLGELAAEPGQFFLWRFVTRQGWWQAHPFSLSAVPDGRRLRFTVKELGDHSRAVASVRPGTRVFAEGPYGSITGRRRSRSKVLLVAGGIGVAPVRALFEALPGGPRDITLLYRATTESDLIFRAELEDLARQRLARLAYILGPREAEPLEASRIRSAIPDVAEYDSFVFGSGGFVDHVQRALVAAGIPKRRVFAERFEM
jgi:predicted ferric reductase